MQERDDLRELKQQKYDKNQNSLPTPEGAGADVGIEKTNLLGIAKVIRSMGCENQPKVRPPETIPWLGVRGIAGRMVGEA